MRTETINIYKFDELSDEAKEKAIEQYKERHNSYAWSDEWIDSLRAFAKAIDIRLRNWQISPYSYSSIDWEFNCSFEFDEDDYKAMDKWRLRTWLINNYLPEFAKGKYYSKNIGGLKYVSRHSKTQIEYNPCPLTGYCGDCSLIEPILEFIKSPKDNYTLKDVVDDCMHSFIKEFNADMEYQDSDEYAIQEMTRLDYEFTEDGKIY